LSFADPFFLAPVFLAGDFGFAAEDLTAPVFALADFEAPAFVPLFDFEAAGLAAFFALADFVEDFAAPAAEAALARPVDFAAAALPPLFFAVDPLLLLAPELDDLAAPLPAELLDPEPDDERPPFSSRLTASVAALMIAAPILLALSAA